MKITVVNILIAFGRKLELLTVTDEVTELTEEALEADKELQFLLLVVLQISKQLIALGLDSDLRQLDLKEDEVEPFLQATVAKYLPQADEEQ